MNPRSALRVWGRAGRPAVYFPRCLRAPNLQDEKAVGEHRGVVRAVGGELKVKS